MFIGIPMMMHSDTPEDQQHTGHKVVGLQGFNQKKQNFTADRVLLSKVGSIKQMVGGFLKGGQHEDALLHLSQSKSGNS